MKRRIIPIIVCILVLSLFSGCSSDSGQPEVPATPMCINAVTDTRAEGGSTDTPVFLFWRASKLTGVGYDISQVTPYCVTQPTGSIDDYEKTQWDTGINYPENNLPVLATGYCPSTLMPSDDYVTLTVPEGQEGKVDVLVAREMVQGSSLSPYIYKEDNEKSLQFIHAQSMLVFKARRGEGVKKYFKEVYVTAGGSELVSTFAWNETDQYYKAQNEAQKECTIGPGETTTQLSDASGQESEVGSIYIMPDKNDIKVSVKAVMANSQTDLSDSNKTKEVTATSVISFIDENKKGITLAEGDRYEITLVFQEDKIELIGRKLPWEEGGNIVIPIYPLPDTEETPAS